MARELTELNERLSVSIGSHGEFLLWDTWPSTGRLILALEYDEGIALRDFINQKEAAKEMGE